MCVFVCACGEWRVCACACECVVCVQLGASLGGETILWAIHQVEVTHYTTAERYVLVYDVIEAHGYGFEFQ